MAPQAYIATCAILRKASLSADDRSEMPHQAQIIAEASSFHALSSLTRSLAQTTSLRDHAEASQTRLGGNADLLTTGRYYHPSMREKTAMPTETLD
jgi:hypothetical protein